MYISQHLTFLKKPSFILALILIIFFLKGAFLAVLHPIFIGQDEARHYNTIQYINEPEGKNWLVDERLHVKNKESIRDYNFSQEIIETGLATDIDRIRDGSLYNTQFFSSEYLGEKESLINLSTWRKTTDFLYPEKAPTTAYHIAASLIERIFSDENILIRFYLIRIFSVILGVLTILFTYLAAKNIGLSSKISLLLTAIISFQPRFSIYYASINYDALLILSFAVFILAGVLILKKGLNWKNLSLLAFAVISGLLAKGTGIVLLAVAILLVLLEIYKKIKDRIVYFLVLLLISVLLIISPYNPLKFLPIGGKESLASTAVSLEDYLLKSITFGRLEFSSKIYWGYVGWINSWFLESFVYFIWLAEIFALIGLILFFISKKKPDFLPEKKYITFFLLMMVALQLGIRAYDWNIFSSTGGFDLGAPGRYFLPTLIAHIVVIFTGLGMLLKKRERFENSLIGGFILMFAFSMYIIFNVIMSRFYL